MRSIEPFLPCWIDYGIGDTAYDRVLAGIIDIIDAISFIDPEVMVSAIYFELHPEAR